MIHFFLESQGKVRENEFRRVVGTMAILTTWLFLIYNHILTSSLHENVKMGKSG